MAKLDLLIKLFITGLGLAVIFGPIDTNSKWHNLFIAAVIIYLIFDSYIHSRIKKDKAA